MAIVSSSSDARACPKPGEKSAISRGFFLKQARNSSLLHLLSPPASNNPNNSWACENEREKEHTRMGFVRDGLCLGVWERSMCISEERNSIAVKLLPGYWSKSSSLYCFWNWVKFYFDMLKYHSCRWEYTQNVQQIYSEKAQHTCSVWPIQTEILLIYFSKLGMELILIFTRRIADA